MVSSKGNNQEATMKNTARLRILILLALAVGALVSSLGALLWGGQDWGGLALNLGSEMAGAVVTYALLELFIGRRERREAEGRELAAKKAALIAQMGSTVRNEAIRAVEELRRHNWLYDGSLFSVDLDGADLQGADMGMADLRGAGLIETNLQGASLYSANLQVAGLARANLQKADLDWTELQGASLRGANLQGASMRLAKLKGTHLSEYTILPDGTKWTPDTDMARFTDPEHPDFWRPEGPS
jgi:hypothetical protein